MNLRYLVLDARGRLKPVSHGMVTGLWSGTRAAAELGVCDAHELRLVSVLRDDRLMPRKVYLLRVPLTDGMFRVENRLTLQLFSMPDCVTPGERDRHHAAGWPADLTHQLAVALDVPLADLAGKLAVGGPLFVAAARSLTPREALRYLR
jgi:hypothetical protein